MGFFKIILTPIKFIFKLIALPIFKLLRKLLWEWTLKKFFKNGLKLTFLTNLVDDFLDIIEAFLKDPASLFIFTNKSLWIIFAPWIISAILFPFKGFSFLQKFMPKSNGFEPVQQIQQPAAPVAPAAPAAPAGQSPEEFFANLAITNPELYQQIYNQQQKGGGIMNIINSSPDFTNYIGIFIFILVLYMIEKTELCSEEHKDKKEEKFLNIFKIGLIFSIFVTLFYISTYVIFPFMPIVGLFYSLATSIPIIGTLVPGILTYFFYNIFRNMTELLKDRTKCL